MSIILDKDQEKHMERMNLIWDRDIICLDTSGLGAGKTTCHIIIGNKRGLKLFAICPANTKPVIEKYAKENNVKILENLSFNIARSYCDRQPGHEYLTRNDEEKVTFTVTQKYKDRVTEGIHLLIDEAHKVKNNSAQSEAVHTLVRYIREQGLDCPSRVSFMTGSGVSSKPQLINLMRSMGFMNNPKLISSKGGRGTITLLGAQELLDSCMKINKDVTLMIDSQTGRKRSEIEDMCFRLFCEVIKPHIISECPMKLDILSDIKNLHCYMASIEEANELDQAIIKMSKTALYNWKIGDILEKKVNYTAIKHDQRQTEVKKVSIFTRLVKRQLAKDETCKVIVFVNFTPTIHLLKDALEIYNPICINGEVDQKERPDLIKKFNENLNYRLLIINLKVGCSSINLHDTIGNSKRYTFVSPTYESEDIHQATGRTRRKGTKSDVTIRIVYGRTEHREQNIIRSLMKKTEVPKAMLEQQVKDGILFPSEYPDIDEENDIN